MVIKSSKFYNIDDLQWRNIIKEQMSRSYIIIITLFFLNLLILPACQHGSKSEVGETARTVVEEKGKPLTISHLEAFYAKETFEVDAKTNRPEPVDLSEHLYKYVDSNYKNNHRVRLVLAKYFLDFHAACLKKRILNYKTEGKNLAEIFVRYEFGEDKQFQRSPSFDYIIAKVSTRGKWLKFDEEAKNKLLRNRELHLRYLESATR